MEANKQITNYILIAMSSLGGLAVGIYVYHNAFVKLSDYKENKYQELLNELLNELSEKLIRIETNEKAKLQGKIEGIINGLPN